MFFSRHSSDNTVILWKTFRYLGKNNTTPDKAARVVIERIKNDKEDNKKGAHPFTQKRKNIPPLGELS